jgi:hypothetical protein
LFRNAQQEEEWLVSVLICVPDERPGCWVEYSKHFDEVPRRTLEAGTSEATRRALYYLCHAYKDELQGTDFSNSHGARGELLVRRFLRSWSPLSARI